MLRRRPHSGEGSTTEVRCHGPANAKGSHISESATDASLARVCTGALCSNATLRRCVCASHRPLTTHASSRAGPATCACWLGRRLGRVDSDGTARRMPVSGTAEHMHVLVRVCPRVYEKIRYETLCMRAPCGVRVFLRHRAACAIRDGACAGRQAAG